MEEKANERKMYKVWATWNYIEAFLLLAAGICGVVFSATGNVSAESPINLVLSLVVGIFVVLDGILRLVMSFYSFASSEESIMLVAGFEVAMGATIILSYTVFIDILVKFIAVLLIVIGLLLVLFSIFTIVKKTSKLFMPILEILFGAILVAVGITILVMYFGNDVGTTNKITVLLVGIIMVLAAVAQAVIASIQFKKSKKKYEVATTNGKNKDTKKDKKSKKDKKEESKDDSIEAEVVETEEIKKIGQKEENDNEKDTSPSVE